MNIFSRRVKLKERGFYVVETGDLAGGFLAWVKELDTKEAHAFLYMPSPMEAMYIQRNEFKEALKSKQIALFTQMKPDAYEVIRANWKMYAKQQGLPYNERKQLNIRRSKH